MCEDVFLNGLAFGLTTLLIGFFGGLTWANERQARKDRAAVNDGGSAAGDLCNKP